MRTPRSRWTHLLHRHEEPSAQFPSLSPVLPENECYSFALLPVPHTSLHKPHWSSFLLLLSRHRFSHLSFTVHRILSFSGTEIASLKRLVAEDDQLLSHSASSPSSSLQLWSPKQCLSWMWRVTWRVSTWSHSLLKIAFSPMDLHLRSLPSQQLPWVPDLLQG